MDDKTAGILLVAVSAKQAKRRFFTRLQNEIAYLIAGQFVPADQYLLELIRHHCHKALRYLHRQA